MKAASLGRDGVWSKACGVRYRSSSRTPITHPPANPQLVQLQIWFVFLGALLIQVDISSNVTSWDEKIFDVLLVIITRGQAKQMIS